MTSKKTDTETNVPSKQSVHQVEASLDPNMHRRTSDNGVPTSSASQNSSRKSSLDPTTSFNLSTVRGHDVIKNRANSKVFFSYAPTPFLFSNLFKESFYFEARVRRPDNKCKYGSKILKLTFQSGLYKIAYNWSISKVNLKNPQIFRI